MDHQASDTTPFFTDAWGAAYRLVSPGVFSFGNDSPNAPPNEQPAHQVDVTEPFFLGERPITQAQWSDVMGRNPSKFQEGWSAGLRPVESVSMDDVEQFLRLLNQRDSGSSYLGLHGRWRLPSEVEWEYAARSGTNGRWSFGDRDLDLDAHGWHAGNSGGHTREVGLKEANPWGFFDMNGLVNEWCSDHWERHLKQQRTQQPYTRADGDRFVVRGGSWFTESDSTRNSARASAARSKRSDGLGLRIVWEPLTPLDQSSSL